MLTEIVVRLNVIAAMSFVFPRCAGVTNYGATDASDYPIAQRPSMVMHLELQETTGASKVAGATPTASVGPSPSETSSSLAAATAEGSDNSKFRSSSSRSQTPAPQNEGFEE